ncbi:30S ribosome-binding factor RbfA [Gammaproteobacteria bacterium ESL0073]|uniref:Ribosome-binding factor A n=1 Tax=Entomomonas moraniae TaxID=2213226 RepID=A0A3S9XBE4_9GAMM|nr:30S ribosome-binding factor RbfA [Entomomonas moraniae]AWM80683.1 30S ribosome-binding factor RbfA [Gammaproteobacteria bacterium ESL0073]AZS49681.1 30S ribosome-binding factor RbfA [Entomomonas moraniae]
MAKEYSRTQRVGDQMQRELAQLIQREIKDPRLGIVTVTAVDVARDLAYAKVFITVMGKDGQKEIEQSLEILTNAAGYLRSLLGKSMKIRTIPQLKFMYDESIVRGSTMSALIDKALAADRKLHHGEDNE